MAEIQIDTVLGSGLAKILDADDIQPGSDVGYELCKLQSGGGGLVAKTKQEGSVAFALMGMAARAKRGVVKEAKNGGVINVTPEEGVESLNLQNVDGALNFARDNIIYDIASGSDVPAILPNVAPPTKRS